MDKYFRYAVLGSIMGLVGLSVMAKPAMQGVIAKSLPDGSTINVRAAGDEYFHQYFTEDGYPLCEKNGFFYYCDFDNQGNIIDSGIKADNSSIRSAEARKFLSTVNMSMLEKKIEVRAAKSPRRASLQSRVESDAVKAPAKAAVGNDGPPYPKGYGLFSDSKFPAYGNQKAIVILVQYTDVKFNSSYDAKSYFTNMLNQAGFSDSRYGGTGSAVDFFTQNSEGAFVPEFDVYGPLTLANNQAYYGGNDSYGNDKNPAAMVKEACDQLDPTVDFREYDRDGDGIVDNVFIFYAGQGEASYGSANTVWPHSWDMVSAGYRNLKYDGVQLYTYGCSNEWEWNRPDGVGTFVHEFSHVMGLPDLYATSYTSAFTPGSWSALDYGPYNNGGMTPPNYGAFERYALGWIKPYEIDRALSGKLKPIDENKCAIIRTSKDTEFFLLENRQQTGWDRYIPGHGMLIWHVDYNKSIWSSNSVNNSANHQYVDIEEADNVKSENTRAADSFPGTAKKTSFTSSTTPAMKNWAGYAVDFPITDIAEQDGIVTFNVLGGGPGWSTIEESAVIASEATNVSADSFTANWESLPDATDYLIKVYTKEESDVALLSENVFEGEKNLPPFETVSSPEFTDFISDVNLSYVSEGISDGDVVFLYAVTPEGSNRIGAFELLPGENDLDIYYIPDETVRLDFIFANGSGVGNVSLKTLDVYHGHETTDMFVEEYNDYSVGCVLSYDIENLAEGKEYYYTVRAFDGESYSLPSNEIKVSTLTSGVKNLSIEDNHGDRAVYYNIQGIQISKPTNGIFLEKKGEKVEKKIF